MAIVCGQERELPMVAGTPVRVNAPRRNMGVQLGKLSLHVAAGADLTLCNTVQPRWIGKAHTVTRVNVMFIRLYKPFLSHLALANTQAESRPELRHSVDGVIVLC